MNQKIGHHQRIAMKKRRKSRRESRNQSRFRRPKCKLSKTDLSWTCKAMILLQKRDAHQSVPKWSTKKSNSKKTRRRENHSFRISALKHWDRKGKKKSRCHHPEVQSTTRMKGNHRIRLVLGRVRNSLRVCSISTKNKNPIDIDFSLIDDLIQRS